MAKKTALLIGVSDYQGGLSPLPSAAKDVEAMQRVLQSPDSGNFDAVKPLVNPDPQLMRQEIWNLFDDLHRDDLVLLFFSGHGVRDDNGRLYLATPQTDRNSQGHINPATSVPASYIHEIMDGSRSKRQVIILDCCYSGAFATGLRAKDDGFIDVRAQFGGEGRAVLTSSTSTQYSFEQQGEALSIYTRYLVEGLETGAADLDGDTYISVDELHEFARTKVRAIAPTMKPEIYPIREGGKIFIAMAPIVSPVLQYRREAERLIQHSNVSEAVRLMLDDYRQRLGVSIQEAAAAEAEVLQPYRQYENLLRQYKQLFLEVIQSEGQISESKRQELKQFQQRFRLKDYDIQTIEKSLYQLSSAPRRLQQITLVTVVISGITLLALIQIGSSRKLLQEDNLQNSPSEENSINSELQTLVDRLGSLTPDQLSETVIKHEDCYLLWKNFDNYGSVKILVNRNDNAIQKICNERYEIPMPTS